MRVMLFLYFVTGLVLWIVAVSRQDEPPVTARQRCVMLRDLTLTGVRDVTPSDLAGLEACSARGL
jgi:hypothetical protein